MNCVIWVDVPNNQVSIRYYSQHFSPNYFIANNHLIGNPVVNLWDMALSHYKIFLQDVKENINCDTKHQLNSYVYTSQLIQINNVKCISLILIFHSFRSSSHINSKRTKDISNLTSRIQFIFNFQAKFFKNAHVLISCGYHVYY